MLASLVRTLLPYPSRSDGMAQFPHKYPATSLSQTHPILRPIFQTLSPLSLRRVSVLSGVSVGSQR